MIPCSSLFPAYRLSSFFLIHSLPFFLSFFLLLFYFQNLCQLIHLLLANNDLHTIPFCFLLAINCFPPSNLIITTFIIYLHVSSDWPLFLCIVIFTCSIYKCHRPSGKDFNTWTSPLATMAGSCSCLSYKMGLCVLRIEKSKLCVYL